MCGFVGYIDGGETQLMEPVLHAMADRIRHRGPDDADYYMDGEISLGFRRLSIIDLEGGRQPILNEDKSKVLMFNGEIYNYQSLREDLLKAGHVFTTKTDSEVLLHGFEEYGTDLLNKLRGMFAFIIWDKNTKTLFGARDYFGIKPFYYAKMQGTLMFGSEIKSFVEHPHFKRELNERALEGYLSFQYSPGYETFFKNVYKLPPAHYFFYKDGKMNMQRYWIPEFNAEEDKPLEYWVDEIEKTFDDSVNAHKIADVEVGSFLSSGVDSSYVACSADVDKTFTVGFDNGEKYNEIRGHPPHVSKTRPQMPMSDRAAQFAPFAALTGYDAAIKETGRLTDERIELDVEALSALDMKYQLLMEALDEAPEVTITYFRPDERKAGGKYVSAVGAVKKIDDFERRITMQDGAKIPMDDVLSIEGELFSVLE